MLMYSPDEDELEDRRAGLDENRYPVCLVNHMYMPDHAWSRTAR
jgi:hypothetical protein